MPFDLSKLQAYTETKEKPEKSESWDDLIEAAFKTEPEKGIPQQVTPGSNLPVTSSGQTKNMPDASDSWDDLISAAFKNEPEVNTGSTPEATGLNDLKNRLADFDKSNQTFLNEWDAKEKELEKVKKSFDPAKANAVLSYFHENGGKRKQLKQEREELLSSIYNHPELIAERKEQAAELEKKMAEVDKLYDGSNVPVLGIGPGAYMMKGKKEQEAEREADRFSRAYKLYENAHDVLLAPSKFDKSNAFLNFAKGAGNVLSDKDFWTGGVSAIARNLDLGSVFKKISENKEGKDFKDLLTPGESSLLDAYYAQVNAQAERAKDLSLGYQAGQGAAQSLEYMAEFLATGGLATAASSGAKKAAMKWVIKHSAPGSLKRQALKGAAWGAEAGVGTLARTPLMPSTYVNVTDPTRQFETDEKGNVLQDEAGRPVLKSGWKVFREGFVDSFIENLSEVSGGHIAGTLGVGGKIVGKVVPQGAREAFAKTGNWLAKSKPGEMYKSFSKSPVWKFLKEGGYNGLLEEWGEEWYGAALRSVLTDPSALKDYATLENQLVTVASFLPMSALGGGVATGQMLKAKGQYKQTLDALQGLMKDLGYKEEQVAYLTDQIEASDAEKMASTIAPLINTLAGENEEKAGELFTAVADFSRAKGNYHLMNGAYEERMAERKVAEDKRMEEETGGYVNSSTGRVEIVADEEGNTAYVAGESLDGDHKVYILNKGGEKISVSREDFEEGYKIQGSFDKDEFLGTIIMNRDLESELASEKKEVQERNEEGQNETIPVTGESGRASIVTYQERPVRIVEGTEQEDGTVIVEDENGETMRVSAVELKVNNITDEQLVNEVQTEDSSSPIQSRSEELAQPEIPLTKEGTPDYNAMSPEMFAEEFEKEFGPEETKSELEKMVTDVEAKIEKLHKKAPTDRNARAENKREILRLTKEKESVLQALERYATEEKVPEENAEVIADYSAEPEITEPEKGEVVNEEELKKEMPASSISGTNIEENSETGAELNPAEAQQEADNYEKGQVKIDGYENKIVKPTTDEVLFREKENYTPEENIEEVNRRFNEELEAFEKGEQKGDLHLGRPGDVLLASGLNNTEIYITPKTLKGHLDKHGLKVDDIKDLPSALREPLFVYEWGDKAKSLVVITNIEHGNERITAAVKLERNGRKLEVNELASVHPKKGGRFVEEMINAKRGGLEEALRNVPDKRKALDWLGLVPPEGTASLTDQELSIANIIENFENPIPSEGEISSSKDDVRFRNIEEVNRRFNQELEQQIAGTLPKGHVYQLGKPSNALKRAGIPDLPIEMASARLLHKSNQENHPFDLSEVGNLPNAVQYPIAVFRSATHIGSNVILTELKQGNKNFVVAIETNRQQGKITVNSVRSIHPRTTTNVVDWINNGLMDYADKAKLKDWVSEKIKSRSYLNSSNPADVKKQLDSVTNIIQNFENSTILEGEISAGIDQLSDELGVPVKKVPGRKELPEGIQRQMKNGRYPGLFDPKAGEVYMVMDEITDVADAQATMLHEIVGHKGIRGLFGDKIGAFTQRVLDSMPENERESWVKKYNGNEQLATEEYVARFAEGYENPSVWEKIKAVVRELFRDLGINLKLSDNDLKYILWKGVRSMQQDGTFMSTAGHIAKDREIQQTLFREVVQDGEFAEKQLNLGEKMRENFQDRMLSVRMLLDEVKRRGGRVTDYANPYVAENLATSKSKAQIDDFNKQLWKPLMSHVKEFTDKGKTREEVDHYMMAKHAQERNALLSERDGKENGSGITNEDAAKIVSEFERDFSKAQIDDFWDSVRKATRFTTDTWQKHGLIDKGSKEYYDKMYQYYVPLRGWEESEADRIEYLDQPRRRGSFNVNKKAKGRNSLADSPLAYIANMAHSAIIAGNKNDVKRNVFDMMALNKNPDLYHLKKVYYVNTGTKEEPVWVEQLERPATELWNEGRVKVDVNRRNEAKREFYKTKQHQVEVFVNGQKYVMEFNGNMGVRVANAVNGINVVHSELLQNSIGRVTRWMTANYTSKNPEFVVTNFFRDLGYAIPAYWMKGGKAGVLLKNMPKAFKAIHDDIAGKKVDSDLQKMYEEFKMNGGLTGYVHMTDIDSYKKWIERDMRRMSGDKTFGDVILRNKAMRAGADLLEYLAQMSENSTRFAVYMSERQEGKSVTEAAYAAKEITTNFNRKGRYSGMLGSLYGFFNATVQGSANALGLAKRSPGKFAVYCGSLIMLQVLASSLCRMFGGDDEIGENNYDRLADWVKYNNLVLPDIGHKGRFITIPLPHFFRALSSLGVIGTEVWNGVKTPGKGLEAMFDAVSGDLTPVEIATPQFKNLPSFLMSVTPTALKPVTEAYAFNRNFMGLPVSREAMGDQKKTLPQSKLAMKRTNSTLISISEWLNKAGGGGEYTTAEIGYNNKTGEIGREDWKTWMDVNPSKFEHVIEGIFGGRLKFFNNIYKTVDNVFKGEFEASTTPVLRPLYQTPKGESAWIKFYEVRDKVVDIDAKASEFMKTGNHDAYGIINYKNAALVETYKAYENVVKALNDALKIVSDPEQAAEIEKQRDEVVKEFAVEVKKLEREYKKEVIK